MWFGSKSWGPETLRWWGGAGGGRERERRCWAEGAALPLLRSWWRCYLWVPTYPSPGLGTLSMGSQSPSQHFDGGEPHLTEGDTESGGLTEAGVSLEHQPLLPRDSTESWLCRKQGPRVGVGPQHTLSSGVLTLTLGPPRRWGRPPQVFPALGHANPRARSRTSGQRFPLGKLFLWESWLLFFLGSLTLWKELGPGVKEPGGHLPGQAAPLPQPPPSLSSVAEWGHLEGPWKVSQVASVVFSSLRSHGLQPTRLLCPWDSPGQNSGEGCHALLQGIFPTQGSNPVLLHCRQILYHLSH